MRAGLTETKVSKLKEPGRYADGDCLYLTIPKTGGKYYVCRVTIQGKQCDIGLGGASYTTLEDARAEAREIRKIARNGGDPRLERRKERLTFEAAARRVHEHLKPTWRNRKHANGWLSTVETYALPVFGEKPVDQVTTADCLKALSPIWVEKHETARRLRQRLSTVFDWAKGAGHYPHENPLNGMTKALPKVRHKPKHHSALAWQDVPAFMADLRKREGVSARALEFLILTACRSGEVRGAKLDEVDGAAWTIPASRMKRGIAHRVPLSAEAQDVLRKVSGLHDELVFPSTTSGKVQSDAAMRALLKRMKRETLTVHGFRSAFRDWASESAHADREVAEAALSHAVGTDTERAYARSDLFERRAHLMALWGQFCIRGAAEVIAFANQ